MAEVNKPGRGYRGVATAIGAGVLSLAVAFLKPMFEKQGAELAGGTLAASPAPSAALPAAPVPSGVTGHGQVAADRPRVPIAHAPAAQVPGPGAPAALARRPWDVVHDIQVPTFEDTPHVEYRHSDGEGRDRERPAAIFKAIEQALSKQGSEFSAAVRLKMESQSSKLHGVALQRMDQSVAADYAMQSDGLIRWWDVASEADEGTNVRVRVLAVVAHVKAAGNAAATRKSVVVLPFRMEGDAAMPAGKAPGAAFGRLVRESLVTSLVNSRKLALLDASFEEEINALDMGQSRPSPVQRAIRAAMKVGAEYVIVGFADGVGVASRPMGKLAVPVPEGMASLRVIRVETRQTVLATSVAVAELTGLNLAGAHPEHAVAGALGRAFSERTLEAIYPIKVAALNGPDELVLNRGGDDMPVGQRLDISNPGEEIMDPASGESLGVAERWVGQIEITRVTPKVAYAKVLSKAEPIAAGAICRRPVSTKPDRAPAESTRSELEKLFK